MRNDFNQSIPLYLIFAGTMYLVKTPFWLRWLYPGLIWKKSRGEKCIYLTFDDGPIPVVTPFVLETLKKFGVKATFFCIGDNIRKHPDIFLQLKGEGHSVGNHTFNHLRGWKTADDIYLDNIKECDALVKSDLFRPPHGRIKKTQISKLKAYNPNMEIIMWDVLSGDFDQKLSPQGCLQNVLRHTENGSIVVFHDSVKAYPRLQHTLPRALEYWKKQGYSFSII